MSFYDYTAKNIAGEEMKMSDLRGHLVLIVNVASACGFTPQYEGLQKLYEKYKERGLKVLAFPCNQFGSQEKGSNSEIAEFCSSKFRVTFDMMDKIDVNGPHAHPLFQFLKKEAPGVLGTSSIKWNFTKFLVSPTGQVLERYSSIVKPEMLEDDIQKNLI